MVYVPSSRIDNLLRVEQAGAWLDRATDSKLWMVAKLPMDVLRSVHSGAVAALCAWVVEIDGHRSPRSV